jgi:hypothetical protein
LVAGRPCDKDGNYLLPDTPPPARSEPDVDNWTPFDTRVEFETADFIYRRNQMSARDINILLDLWAASLFMHGDQPPFADHTDLYNTIDAIPHGDVRWENFTTCYNGEKPDGEVPPWMETEYEVWFRDPRTIVQNMLANPDFSGEMDYSPFREFRDHGERHFQDFMSGDWAWQQAVCSPLTYVTCCLF